jgi:hypothetical protein
MSEPAIERAGRDDRERVRAIRLTAVDLTRTGVPRSA